MRFHWMLNNSLSIDDKKTIISDLEHNGYEYVLIPFNEFHDPFITAVYLQKYTSSLKFFIAVRPYVMTPMYCALLCKTIDEINHGLSLIHI